MKAKFVQDGKAINIAAGSDGIAAGDVVINGELVGVAKTDIPANTVGAIATEGVYEIVKGTAATFNVGDAAYWNATSGCVQGSASGLAKIGTAVEAAVSGAETVKVKIG